MCFHCSSIYQNWFCVADESLIGPTFLGQSYKTLFLLVMPYINSAKQLHVNLSIYFSILKFKLSILSFLIDFAMKFDMLSKIHEERSAANQIISGQP